MTARAKTARFGTRAGIAALTAFCFWAGAMTKKGRDQRMAVDAVRSAGGRVVYDYQQLANQLGFFQWEVPAQRPSWNWLDELWGGDVLVDVNAVSLSLHGEPALRRTEFAYAMSAIPRTYGLKSLGVACSELNGADLKRIGCIRSLRHLTLYDASASPTELAFLGNLTNLQELSLTGRRIDGAGLRHLARLQNLRSLYLAGEWLSDRDLAYLKPLTSLSSLSISSNQITAEGLASLAGLRHLRHLSLSSPSVDAAGMRVIARLPALDYLDLGHCRLSEGVAELAELRNARRLKTLEFDATEMGPAAWRALGEIPNLRRLTSYQNAAVDDEVFRAIKRLTNLESLTVLMAPHHQRELSAVLPRLSVISD